MGSDPVNFIDPTGLEYAEVFAAAGALTGASVAISGSIVLDAATGGLNVLATPAEIAIGAMVGGTIGYGVGSLLDVWNESGEEATDSSAQDKFLTKGEIKKFNKYLEGLGEDVHEIKLGADFDLYKKSDGSICVKPKGGIGEGEPTGYNVKDFMK